MVGGSALIGCEPLLPHPLHLSLSLFLSPNSSGCISGHKHTHTLAGRLIQDPVLVLLPPFSAKKREEG